MKDDMQGMCGQWNAVDVIRIKFLTKVWKIEITKREGVTSFGPSWFDFCDYATLKPGDILIFRSFKDRFKVLGCVLKMSELQLIDESIGK